MKFKRKQTISPTNTIKNILFLDTNICIKIRNAVSNNISYCDMDDKLKLLKDKNQPDTIVFSFPYLFEGGYRRKNYDYKKNLEETFNDAEYIKKFFDKSIDDIETIKQLEPDREKFEVGKDFQFDKQIIFYESLRDIIYCGKDKEKNIDIQNEIIDKARECSLKLYYPIVISAIAVLYHNKKKNDAESFLKLKKQGNETLSINVVNDMTNILRFSSFICNFRTYPFRNFLHSYHIEFVTEDKELDKFIKCCKIKSLSYLINGNTKGSCPINKKYFPLASNKEWKDLKNIFSKIYI